MPHPKWSRVRWETSLREFPRRVDKEIGLFSPIGSPHLGDRGNHAPHMGPILIDCFISSIEARSILQKSYSQQDKGNHNPSLERMDTPGLGAVYRA